MWTLFGPGTICTSIRKNNNELSVYMLQMFINGALLEEIPFSRVKDEPQMPADNKLYVGCRVHNLEEKDFTNAEIDELAFWNHYIPDDKLKWFTGAISKFCDLICVQLVI